MSLAPEAQRAAEGLATTVRSRLEVTPMERAQKSFFRPEEPAEETRCPISLGITLKRVPLICRRDSKPLPPSPSTTSQVRVVSVRARPRVHISSKWVDRSPDTDFNARHPNEPA